MGKSTKPSRTTHTQMFTTYGYSNPFFTDYGYQHARTQDIQRLETQKRRRTQIYQRAVEQRAYMERLEALQRETERQQLLMQERARKKRSDLQEAARKRRAEHTERLEAVQRDTERQQLLMQEASGKKRADLQEASGAEHTTAALCVQRGFPKFLNCLLAAEQEAATRLQ